MEIKKFEAYQYKGPDLMKLNRHEILDQIVDNLSDCKIAGYDSTGTKYHNKDEILYIYLNKDIDDIVKILKLDFSDMGIEIGDIPFDEETGEEDDFIPEINLDSNQTKQLKTYKNDLRNFNV